MMNSTPHEPSSLTLAAEHMARTTRATLVLPFDVAREMYARAVKSGLVRDSMIACARYARDLNANERLALGPWARSI